MNFLDLDGLAIAEGIRAGRWTAAEITHAAIDRAKTVGAKLNCYTEIFEHKAIEDAQRIDVQIQGGKDVGPLAGVPIAVKNLFDVTGTVTIAGSKIDREKSPAKQDATALKKLRTAGAVLIGCLGMDEYAYGFTNENTHYGAIRNPHDPDRVPGGSSGGSGSAVGSACVPLALGTDTNGSVRVPAALCGVFGLKPTYGRISRAGVTPFTPSLDHVGVLTRTVRDAALAFDLMHGHDVADPVSSDRPKEQTSESLDQGTSGLRIARAIGYFSEEATAEALQATDTVARALKATTGLQVSDAKAARHAAMIISAVEGSALHMHNLQTRPGDFDPMTRDRFIAGALLAGEMYVQAQLFRQSYRATVRELFRNVDILVAPATPMPAPKIGQTEIEIDGRIFPSRVHLGKFTQPISFIGLPVMTVPLRSTSGLPVGVQLIGAPYSEAKLLRTARELELAGVVKALPAQREIAA